LSVVELVRKFYIQKDDQLQTFEFAEFKKTNKVRWRYSLGFFKFSSCCLYTRNISRVLAGTDWKHSCLYELTKATIWINAFAYLGAYQESHVYEYLVKLRLYRLVIANVMGWGNNRAKLNLDGCSSREVLGIGREQLLQMQRLNGSIEHLKLIKCAQKAGVPISDSHVELLVEMGISDYLLDELMQYVTPYKIVKYIGQVLEKWPKAEQANRWYVQKNYALDIATLWRDYLDNCRLLGYDMKNTFVLFPKNLKTRHDDVMGLVSKQKKELLENAISNMYQQLDSRYGFVGKKMLVKVPQSASEIVADGHTLHHCAGTGSYIENMATGKCVILFVRLAEEPEKPYFTLEVRDGMVIQCRGYDNADMPLDVKTFIKKWEQSLKVF